MPLLYGFHPITGEPIYARHQREGQASEPVTGKTAPGMAAQAEGTNGATVDAKGRFIANFATFNVIDADGDVTLPGAFAAMEGKSVPLSAYGHSSWEGSMPIGSGTIHGTSTHAEIHGHLLMDTAAGAHMHSVLRDSGSELSYGFVVRASHRGTHKGEPVRYLDGVEIFEVSFVLRGAGLGTGLLELDGDLKNLSPEAREAIIDFRRLEARIDHPKRRTGRLPDEPKVRGFKVPSGLQPK